MNGAHGYITPAYRAMSAHASNVDPTRRHSAWRIQIWRLTPEYYDRILQSIGCAIQTMRAFISDCKLVTTIFVRFRNAVYYSDILSQWDIPHDIDLDISTRRDSKLPFIKDMNYISAVSRMPYYYNEFSSRGRVQELKELRFPRQNGDKPLPAQSSASTTTTTTRTVVPPDVTVTAAAQVEHQNEEAVNGDGDGDGDAQLIQVVSTPSPAPPSSLVPTAGSKPVTAAAPLAVVDDDEDEIMTPAKRRRLQQVAMASPPVMPPVNIKVELTIPTKFQEMVEHIYNRFIPQ
jgi:hypothetical protein